VLRLDPYGCVSLIIGKGTNKRAKNKIKTIFYVNCFVFSKDFRNFAVKLLSSKMNNDSTLSVTHDIEPVKPIRRPRLTIRIGQGSLAFAAPDATAVGQVRYLPYTVRSGVSMAANLREAFKTEDMLNEGWTRAQVMVDTPTVMLPLEDFFEQDEQRNSLFYHHAITGHEHDVVLSTVLPSLNAAVLFAMNKDLKLVVDDHFEDVRFMALSQPVWGHLHRRSFTGTRRKLYGYFHDKSMEVFAFQQNRFRFCNRYAVTTALDAVFFLLAVWQQLGMDTQKDELHVVGTLPDKEAFLTEIRKYLQNAYVINPVADYNRAPITAIKDIPYDLCALMMRS